MTVRAESPAMVGTPDRRPAGSSPAYGRPQHEDVPGDPMTPRPLRVPLITTPRVSWGEDRLAEPVTFGVPLPSGAVRPGATAVLDDGDRFSAPVSLEPLDFWPDGSVRWVLCDTRVDASGGRPRAAAVCFHERLDPQGPAVQVQTAGSEIVIRTGAAEFRLGAGHAFPFSGFLDHQGRSPLPPVHVEVDTGTGPVRGETVSAVVHRSNPHRAEVELVGRWQGAGPAVALSARAEFLAGSATVRLALSLHNPQRAQHQGGQWGLGDPASILIKSAALIVGTPATGTVEAAVEAGQGLRQTAIPFELFQASAGGDMWNGPVHRNRNREVALDFRGYRVSADGHAHSGERAAPIVRWTAGSSVLTVAVPEFWQESPRAISIDSARTEIGLFPRQARDPQELQGGERKTHRLVLAFGPDGVTEPPLAWCHDPLEVGASPDWVYSTGAVPHMLPRAAGGDPRYEALVDEALHPVHGFDAKREAMGEFGWRNWGDLPADHESAFQPADQPFVSHYNNQYDPIAGCAFQYLRTGDVRWRRLMSQIARHVADIDIYRTTGDKSAYNGGLFWHTAHYVDAGLSTHRTYPPGGPHSGGPSSEHNYNAGFMWHYFLTGDSGSREAAVALGRWVVAMDDGRQTVFRWLAGGATGLATETAGHQGPGRGAGHSILALLVADRLTRDPVFLAKAAELIRRTAHPSDEVERRGFEDIERQWSYTAFLQALGAFVAHTQERPEHAYDRAYARACLLHYARWMRVHETPYLSAPERLEFPTETWAAQDLRKAEVFLWAALFGPAAERDGFLERASFFFNDAVGRLEAMPTHVFTRPTVLALSFGVRQAWFDRFGRALDSLPPDTDTSFGRPVLFQPQKDRAIRRAKMLVVAGGAVLVAAAAAVIYWWSVT